MSDYVFIASERVDNLYVTLRSSTQKKESVETKLGGSIASVTYKEETIFDISAHEKIEYILQRITTSNVFSDESAYIEDCLPLSWNSQNKIDSHLSATFWIGSFDRIDNSPYDETVLLLIGSDYNIVGNSKKAGQYYSTSYIDAFFKSFEKSLNPRTFELSNMDTDRRASSDLENLRLIEKLDKETDSNITKLVFSEEWCIARYINELRDTYTGNYCKYRFVAQLLFSRIFLEDKKVIRYVIAAPLFVQREKILGKRTLYTKQGIRYFLTEIEYFQHKKTFFRNLPLLLKDEGFNEQANELGARLNNELNILKSKKNIVGAAAFWKKYIEMTEPIVMEYFFVK